MREDIKVMSESFTADCERQCYYVTRVVQFLIVAKKNGYWWCREQREIERRDCVSTNGGNGATRI